MLLSSILFVILSACSGNKRVVDAPVLSAKEIKEVEISVNGTYYDFITKNISDTAFVILHENNNTMYSNADKIMSYNDKYYVLDRSTFRTVVSFKKDGSPVTRYGHIGQGPGEYVFPWDIDVDETGVYVLDTNSKKVIHYSEQGTLLNERAIPFFADAIKRLENGNFMFNITPNGEQISSLVITDSLMNPIREMLPYVEGYVGGCSTSDIFRKNSIGICFYRSPLDSLMFLDESGSIKSLIFLNFLDKSIPPKAKTDYVAFRQSGDSKSYLRLVNTPIALSDSIWVGLVEDGSHQYTLIFNPLTNHCGGKKFTRNSSVFDMIEPMFSDGKGTVVSLISGELENRCMDYKSLPDTIKNALSLGNRVLLIHKFSI